MDDNHVMGFGDRIVKFMYLHDNRSVKEIRVMVIRDHSDGTVLLLFKIIDVGAMIGSEGFSQRSEMVEAETQILY